jgi:hypothetical protein
VSALHTDHLYPQEIFLVLISVKRSSRPQGHSATGRIMLMKKSRDTIGNRPRDLPVCSAVPQTLRHRVPPVYEEVSIIFRINGVKIIDLTTKRIYKMPTSTQLRATWYNDSLAIVVLPSTGASRYNNCCIGGGTSAKYFGYTLVVPLWVKKACRGNRRHVGVTEGM